MALYGLTATGFLRKTLENILSEIESSEKATIDTRIDVSADTPIGQLNGVMAEKLAELWELADDIVAGGDPDVSAGFQLDQVSSITGTTRDAASKGTVSLDLSLNATTTVPVGSIVQVLDDPTNRWVTTSEGDNPAGVPAIVAVTAEAETAGAVTANASTITVIVTPVSGWTAVTNPLDAVPGVEVETDSELRIKRQAELALGGTSPVNAIRADVLQVPDVLDVSVFDNPTDVTDGNGVPPHAVEVLVRGGDDQAIGDQLFDSVAAGIATFGTTSTTVRDSQGFDHTVDFTRPTQIDLYLEVDIDVDPDVFPVSGGEDEIKLALVAWQELNLGVGDDVALAKLAVPICETSGVKDITEIRIGLAPSPVQITNFIIATRELADFDTSRIVVNVTTV